MQLNLAILPRVTYKAENFVLHQGVTTTHSEVLAIVSTQKFASCFVYGNSRSGKTHLAFRLSEDLLQRSFYSKIVPGDQFEQLISKNLPEEPDQIYLIDDSQLYFDKLQPGQSGLFVRWMEELRMRDGRVVFLSNKQLKDFSFDDHTRSRVNAGAGFEIGLPAEQDLPALIDAIARQRGIGLSEKKTEFLEKRLRRDIAAIEEYVDRLVHLALVLGRPVKFNLLHDAL